MPVLIPRDQRFGIIGGVKESAPIMILKVGKHEIRQPLCSCDPASSSGRLVQRDESFDRVGVIVDIPIQVRLSMTIRVQQPAVAARHVGQDELSRLLGSLHVAGLIEHTSANGECFDRQRVPGGQDFVVTARMHTLFSRRSKQLAVAGELLGEGFKTDGELACPMGET